MRGSDFPLRSNFCVLNRRMLDLAAIAPGQAPALQAHQLVGEPAEEAIDDAARVVLLELHFA